MHEHIELYNDDDYNNDACGNDGDGSDNNDVSISMRISSYPTEFFNEMFQRNHPLTASTDDLSRLIDRMVSDGTDRIVLIRWSISDELGGLERRDFRICKYTF